mmetsp:Transcript_56015/g.133460  ORF Transcript_56015/g.133460 Transcript_56015/m.133460 type:complete len:257 (+) Transcript_56015:83-853(+)
MAELMSPEFMEPPSPPPPRPQDGDSNMIYPVITAAFYGDVDALGGALREGADVNEQDNREGWRPLHAAIFTESEDALAYLLRLKADVNLPGPEGMTALHMAAKHKSASTVKRLLARQGNREALNSAGQTVYDVARANPSADVLLALGLEVPASLQSGEEAAPTADGAPVAATASAACHLSSAPLRDLCAGPAAAAAGSTSSSAPANSAPLLGRAGEGDSWFGSAVHPDRQDEEIDPLYKDWFSKPAVKGAAAAEEQ